MESHSLVPEGPVLLALSAGKDSMLLYNFMKEFSRERQFSFSVFHLNHCMRGAESDADEAFLENLCSRDGVEFISRRHDFSAESSVSFEARARELRYCIIGSIIEENGFSCAMTAHTKSDQVETVLMRICTGTHIRGLAGIPSRRGLIVRPLLCCESDEICAFLRERDFAWREDLSNEDTGYSRNFIRHEMIPLMTSRFPRSSSTIADLSEAAAESQSVILRLLSPHGIVFHEDAGTVKVLYHEMLREKEIFGFCCAELVSRLGGYLSRERIDEAFKRAESLKDHLVLYDDGTVLVERDRSRKYLVSSLKKKHQNSPDDWIRNISFSDIPCAVDDVPFPLQLSLVSYEDFLNCRDNSGALYLSLDGAESFVLRSRKAGDEIKSGGISRKLKNLFIDLKCDQYEKKAVPVVEIGGAVAAAGTGFTGRGFHRVSDSRSVTTGSKKILAIYRVKTEH